ncbi:MAG: hypothetical protein ACREXU_07440 [Gammaproteobacteria bacterium]
MLERWHRAIARGRLLGIAQEMRALTQGIMVRAIFGQVLVRARPRASGVLEYINERVWALFDLARLPMPRHRQLRGKRSSSR